MNTALENSFELWAEKYPDRYQEWLLGQGEEESNTYDLLDMQRQDSPPLEEDMPRLRTTSGKQSS